LKKKNRKNKTDMRGELERKIVNFVPSGSQIGDEKGMP